jgi:hypothetical protein
MKWGGCEVAVGAGERGGGDVRGDDMERPAKGEQRKRRDKPETRALGAVVRDDDRDRSQVYKTVDTL